MSDRQISQLNLKASLLGTDQFAVDDASSVTWKVNAVQILSYINTSQGFTGGILGISHGGTGANLTAALGAIPYSNSTAFQLLAPGSVGQLFQSGGSGSPNWTTATFPTSTTINQILFSSANNTVTGLPTLGSSLLTTNNLGVPSFSTVLPGGLTTTDPTVPQGLATKVYVDNAITGMTFQGACYVSTTANLNAVYNNGSSGIGASLTDSSGTFLPFMSDGQSPAVGARILVKSQVASYQNGIYVLTTNGDSISIPYVLTRSTDYDTPAQINPGDFVGVLNGTINSSTYWTQTSTVNTIGTDPVTFLQSTASLPISVSNGGTGRTTSTTAYGLIAAGTTATGSFQTLSTGSSGQILQSGGSSALPSYSTATYPSVATSTGSILRANGTNWLQSTALFSDTYSASSLLYSNGSNNVVGLATANNSVLSTNGSGVPSLSTTLPSGLTIPGYQTTITPAALTKVDDTNVTLTLGGTPATSLLQAVSLTLGWTGQLGVSRGGSGLGSLTTYALITGGTTSTGAYQQVATGTSGFLLQSGGSGALPTFTGTPNLGTPSAGILTNCTGLPISTGVSGLGSGIAAFLATPSSANLAAALTDETGTGANVFANTPTLVTPILGTPTSGTLTNCTGLPVSTGISGLASGMATFLATPSSANLAATVTDETGTGSLVFSNSPTLVSPVLGAASATSLTFTSTSGIIGTTTNNNAAAGSVGELIESSIPVGSAVSLTTATAANVTSISLTAGDWMVYGNIWTNPAGTTSTSIIMGAISTTSATIPLAPNSGASVKSADSFTLGQSQGIYVGQTRVSIASTTTVYLVIQVTFAISTMGGYGYIGARRLR